MSYELEYLELLGFEVTTDARAVSSRFPTTFEEYVEPTWPAFLLDLIPSGHARRFWERELGLPNTEGPQKRPPQRSRSDPSAKREGRVWGGGVGGEAPDVENDWSVLVRGAGNPPGNVRVASAAEVAPLGEHPGFERGEILERRDAFIEYARSRGASVAGGSGAAGDAPKFLLREDDRGRWHADGALDDARTRASWLVKFPRSAASDDRLVLEAEAPYARVASRFGVRVAAGLTWERDCLFVPRFDRRREADGSLGRLGLESLYSLAGVAAFGAPTSKDVFARALARCATDPRAELRELLLRDVLDVALGNTDNHGRNTSVLKEPRGPTRLSPLYDFAPMILDVQGIARVSRWDAEREGYPEWGAVADSLAVHGLEPAPTKAWLRALAPRVAALPDMMRDEGVPARVIHVLTERVARVARSLEATR
ncbi:MAG: HipA domain-containing protein [Labilithrix sp.]|nr:HipA domain-containing protein [Labilithrix sp.]MCW5812717.1 HipA domain-containing protein [Labilithrix sp.]